MGQVTRNDVIGQQLCANDHVVFCLGGRGASGMVLGVITRVLPKTVEVRVGSDYYLRTPDNVVNVEERLQ